MKFNRTSFHLGTQLLHADRRLFEITDLFYGENIRYSVGLENGYTIHEESIESELKAIGFHLLAEGCRDEKKIIRTVQKMNEWIQNKHISIAKS